VDLRSAKSNFYYSFNNIFHSAASYQNELVVLHLVSAYCKPYLLYGSECMDLNVTQIRSIERGIRVFVMRCGVVGSTLGFGSIGHEFESEHRLFHIIVHQPSAS